MLNNNTGVLEGGRAIVGDGFQPNCAVHAV